MSFSLFDNGEFELESRFSPQQSFYNKASVIVSTDGMGGVAATLRSYLTSIVTVHSTADGDIESIRWLNGDPADWSNTTWRHIREFFKQAGLKADSKAQCLRDYVREVD